MDPIDAVALAAILRAPTTRRALLRADRTQPEPSDQRRGGNLCDLLARIRAPPPLVGGRGDAGEAGGSAAAETGVEQGHVPLVFDQPGYPPALAAIPDPPPVLWLLGCTAVCTRPAVAIVGSRAGSPYACEVAHRLGTDLSDRGIAVVSGLARGVDGAAHQGALSGPGGTIAVLGSGLDVIYPPEHTDLAHAIASDGALVSECPPGAFPLASVSLPPAESDYQWLGARCGRGRGFRTERLAHHSPLRGRPGA